jgi:hypothetical protein
LDSQAKKLPADGSYSPPGKLQSKTSYKLLSFMEVKGGSENRSFRIFDPPLASLQVSNPKGSIFRPFSYT